MHRFKILSTPFRHALAMHPKAFARIAQIADINIALHPLRRNLLELPRHSYYVDRDEVDPAGWATRTRIGVLIA